MKKITISSLLVILFITACTEAQLSKASKQLGDVLDQGLSTEDVEQADLDYFKQILFDEALNQIKVFLFW